MNKILMIGLVITLIVIVGYSEKYLTITVYSSKENPSIYVYEYNSSEISFNYDNQILGIESLNNTFLITFNHWDQCQQVKCPHTNNSLAYCVECPSVVGEE